METQLNRDGQPTNSAFNSNRNKSKVASSLRGILLGIAADSELNETELLFLNSWLESQEDQYGDILDLSEEVKSLLKEGYINASDYNDLLQLVNDCIHYGELRDDSQESGVNEFFGLMEGIVSDNLVVRSEFDVLERWINENPELVTTWPISAIKERIDLIWEDDIVTEEELADLCSYMKDITGTDFTEIGDAVGGATEAFCEEIQISHLKGRNVCLTGKFLSGTRDQMNSLVREHGGIPQKNVTKKTDLVVIGTLQSKDWIYSSAGRKVEKALQLREDGAQIIVTSEQVFKAFCNGLA